MDKKAMTMHWGTMIRLALGVLLLIVIIIAATGEGKNVFNSVKDLIFGEDIEEELDPAEHTTTLTDHQHEAIEKTMHDIKNGFEKCRQITANRKPEDGVCKCDINIREWSKEGDWHYMYRLTDKKVGGALLEGFTATDDDVSSMPESDVVIEDLDWLTPCVSSTFEEFDETKDNFGLSPVYEDIANLYRGDDGYLYYGKPRGFTNTYKDNIYGIGGPMDSDNVRKTQFSLLRFDSTHFCFMIARDEDEDTKDSELYWESNWKEYLENLQKIPNCVPETPIVNPYAPQTPAEANCAMAICNEAKTSDECYDMQPCCTWGDNPNDNTADNVCYDELI